MINASVITKALVAQLKADAEVIKNDMNVSRSAYINYDPDLAPWVGVYLDNIPHIPASMGRHGKSWAADVNLNILVQASNFDSGEKCEELLNEYLKVIADALWADPTIGKTVQMIKSFILEYSYEYTESETTFYQWCLLKLVLEVRTG